MRTFLLTMVATSALALASCSTTAPDSPTPDPAVVQDASSPLFGKLWYNSYEAQATETPIYRPKGYEWATPPQRYNMPFEGGDGFRLDADGQATYIAPGIGPGPTTHAGTWKREDSNKSIYSVHITDNSQPDFRLEIVSVEADRLTARYLR